MFLMLWLNDSSYLLCMAMTDGASALVTLMERIAHKSRFDPIEVCPGVGTVVTAVLACGVPEWWHSLVNGWHPSEADEQLLFSSQPESRKKVPSHFSRTAEDATDEEMP
ncbi:hypothetical protein Taro_026377 [Colocasia esculenta]|uniref:Uncharacterized protein n=1 Tax=Colocasia esculenta TaxID=4460 RepID=A0A843VR49_COLES|nr:hypothetical protein [Colocasia esculenta]